MDDGRVLLCNSRALGFSSTWFFLGILFLNLRTTHNLLTYNVSYNSMDEACQWQALDDGPSDSVGRNEVMDDGRVLLCNSRALGFSSTWFFLGILFLNFRTTHNLLTYNVFSYQTHTPAFGSPLEEGIRTNWATGNRSRFTCFISASSILNFRTTYNVPRTTFF